MKAKFENIWGNNLFLWQLRSRELLQDIIVDGKAAGCASCKDKYLCGGCRTIAYS